VQAAGAGAPTPRRGPRQRKKPPQPPRRPPPQMPAASRRPRLPAYGAVQPGRLRRRSAAAAFGRSQKMARWSTRVQRGLPQRAAGGPTGLGSSNAPVAHPIALGGRLPLQLAPSPRLRDAALLPAPAPFCSIPLHESTCEGDYPFDSQTAGDNSTTPQVTAAPPRHSRAPITRCRRAAAESRPHTGPAPAGRSGPCHRLWNPTRPRLAEATDASPPATVASKAARRWTRGTRPFRLNLGHLKEAGA
jgi:hypothetical protein